MGASSSTMASANTMAAAGLALGAAAGYAIATFTAEDKQFRNVMIVTGPPGADDTKEALYTRLQKFHEETVPVLTHYEPTGVVSKVNGDQGKAAVWAEIEAVLPKPQF